MTKESISSICSLAERKNCAQNTLSEFIPFVVSRRRTLCLFFYISSLPLHFLYFNDLKSSLCDRRRRLKGQRQPFDNGTRMLQFQNFTTFEKSKIILAEVTVICSSSLLMNRSYNHVPVCDCNLNPHIPLSDDPTAQ